MKKCKINKTGINFMICILIFIKYDSIHDFLVWLRPGSDSADISPFRRHTGNVNSVVELLGQYFF